MKWIIFVIVLILIVTFFVILKRKQDELEKNFKKKLTGKKIRLIDKYALYIASESDGYSHFRGTGYLVLTDQELYFERMVNKKIIKIPLESILKVEETKRLAGQSTGRMMLKVVYNNFDGKQNATAWRIKNLKEWVREISNIIENYNVNRRE